MSEAAEKLKPALDALTSADRFVLIKYLVKLHDEEELSTGEWEAEWVEEINRRVADSKAGKTVSIPHEEVMRQMKEKYG